MKIIIFGIGDIYNKVKHYFDEEKAEIVALVDNNHKLFATVVDGHVVDTPPNIQRYQYDSIVITSNYAIEMRQQLIELGIRQDRIMHYRDYIGSIPIEVPGIKRDDSGLSVLILSNDFGYHGGSIACLNLARILKQKGYGVTMAAPSADQKFLKGISQEENIETIIIENLAHLSRENLKWACGYTYILANTIVMARCAVKLAERRRVFLWIHESVDAYTGFGYWCDEIASGLENNRLIIRAVSEVARNNFLSVYQTKKEVGLLPYGVDDRCTGDDFCGESGVTTFTIVAQHAPLKGLDVLFDAMHFVSEEERRQCRFLFVGKAYDTEYGKRVRSYMEQNANYVYLGELSREKLFELYSKTDIVIIPSRRDSLPLVATEAMMLKKPCIISDSIGTAKYLKHKYNGLIFKNESREELAELICWCLQHREDLKVIAQNARKTYETWFTMNKFGERVLNIIEELK